LREAERIPRGIPRRIANDMATMESSIVAGNFSNMTSKTGRKEVDVLIPQSPWNKPDRYKKY